MTDFAAAATEPLRRRNNPELVAAAATMSRHRFVIFQMVTVVTALITCFTLLSVTMLQNKELQTRLIHWGDKATCILENSANVPTDLPLYQEDPESAEKQINWSNVLLFMLNLKKECAANLTIH